MKEPIAKLHRRVWCKLFQPDDTPYYNNAQAYDVDLEKMVGEMQDMLVSERIVLYHRYAMRAAMLDIPVYATYMCGLN